MLKHLGTKTLETQRLILRKIQITDAQAMFDNWASDPVVTRYLSWPAHASVEITEMVINSWLAEYSSDAYYQWVIVSKDSGQPIGTIGLVQICADRKSAEVDYCLGQPWWQQGIMSEALDVVMKYLLEKVGFCRIEARHDARNPRSGAVMRKCGMVYEGTFREMMGSDHALRDICHYAKTAETVTR